MYWVGVVTAGMTAFYVWRAFWMTFWGDYKGHGHPHESPLVDAGAAGRARGAFASSADSSSTSRRFWRACSRSPKAPTKHDADRVFRSLFGLGGIALSYYMYVVNTELPEQIASSLGGLYTLSTTNISSMRSTMPLSSTR